MHTSDGIGIHIYNYIYNIYKWIYKWGYPINQWEKNTMATTDPSWDAAKLSWLARKPQLLI